jgi:hypothetical protein
LSHYRGALHGILHWVAGVIVEIGIAAAVNTAAAMLPSDATACASASDAVY